MLRIIKVTASAVQFYLKMLYEVRMKKRFGILEEFKKFITRGNVLDLAVGMIIGAAFTAIVTALVDGIFKPLINAIPMGDISGLITMLRPAYTESGAIDLSNSVYINWGEFIMAVINFLLTAIILFSIIKVINTFRGEFDGYNKAFKSLSKEEKAQLRKQGMTSKQIKEYAENKAREEEERAKAEAEANKPETTDDILKDIRKLLQGSNGESEEATEASESVDK